jgi:hypothetical protein
MTELKFDKFYKNLLMGGDSQAFFYNVFQRIEMKEKFSTDKANDYTKFSLDLIEKKKMIDHFGRNVGSCELRGSILEISLSGNKYHSFDFYEFTKKNQFKEIEFEYSQETLFFVILAKSQSSQCFEDKSLQSVNFDKNSFQDPIDFKLFEEISLKENKRTNQKEHEDMEDVSISHERCFKHVSNLEQIFKEQFSVQENFYNDNLEFKEKFFTEKFSEELSLKLKYQEKIFSEKAKFQESENRALRRENQKLKEALNNAISKAKYNH